MKTQTTVLSLLAGLALLAGCATHSYHAHQHEHGPNCGHTAVVHEGHIDYLDDGHLHHAHGDHADEHTLAVSSSQPDQCTSGHDCSSHAGGHMHSVNCSHPLVPHGDHADYLVDGHLHHSHGLHCDNHGMLTVVE